MKAEDVKVKVKFTEGYRKRYTEACLRKPAQRERRRNLTPPSGGQAAESNWNADGLVLEAAAE